MMTKNAYVVILVFLIAFILFCLLSDVIYISPHNRKLSIKFLLNLLKNKCKKLCEILVKMLYKLKSLIYNKTNKNK